MNYTNIDFAAEGSQVACFLDAVAVAWRWAVETVGVVVWTHLLGKGVVEEAEYKAVVGMERRTVIGYPGGEEEVQVAAECAEFVATAEASLVDFVVKSLVAVLYGKIPLVGY